MAEIVGLVGSVVGILTAAEVAYDKIKSMEGLPRAFSEARLRVPLAREILKDIESQSQDAPQSTANNLLPLVNSCKGNADNLKQILEDLGTGDSTSTWHLDRYVLLIKSRGKKACVEDLMKNILNDIQMMANYQIIRAAVSDRLAELRSAIQELGMVEKSATDESLGIDGVFNIHHDGQGHVFSQSGPSSTLNANLGTWNTHNNNIQNAHFGVASVDALHTCRDEETGAIQHADEYRIADQRKRTALRALDCASYETHKNNNPKAMSETCRWFTEHETFRRWINSNEDQFLWVSADPGCGKSVLARYMIDNKEVLKTSRVLYFFFKDGSEDQNNTESAVKCLLHQLLKDNSEFFTEEIVKSLEELGRNRSEKFLDLWGIFLKVVGYLDQTKTICVLDALDECKAEGWREMAEALGILYQTGNPALRFIFLSRPYDQIRRSIREGQIQHINLRGEGEAVLSKISTEIDSVIDRKVKDLVKDSKLSTEEAKMVYRRLTKARNRTYLWAHVICDMLKGLHRVHNNNLRDFLDRLPETVEDAYDSILRRSTDVQTAKTLLHIIVAAVRPLTVSEMAEAMAVDGHQSSYSNTSSVMDTNVFSQNMRTICGLFVVVIQDKVHLIHQTAREFLIRDDSRSSPTTRSSRHSLKWEACLSLVESNRIMAIICIQRLINTDKAGFLFDYSARYWISHYHHSNLREGCELNSYLVQLCDTSWGGFTAWYDIFEKTKGTDIPFKVPILPDGHYNSLELASSLDIEPAVKALLTEKGLTIESGYSGPVCYSLIWVAINGSHKIAKLLLEARHQITHHHPTDIGLPLVFSSAERNVAFVEMLLGAENVTFNEREGMKALSDAERGRHDHVVKLLMLSSLKCIAEPDSMKWLETGRTISRHHQRVGEHFKHSVERGYLEALKLLINTPSVDPDSTCRNGQTPLSYAAKLGHLDMVKMLLRTGRVDPNSTNSGEGTPLSKAASRGHYAVVKYLLDTGKVDVDPKDGRGTTPLCHAIRNGHSDIVNMLLETGRVDINSRDRDGLTPIAHAAARDDLTTVKLLHNRWKAKIDMTRAYIFYPSAVYVALRNDSESVLRYFLDARQMDVNFEFSWELEWGDIYCRTLLREAVKVNSPRIVSCLLEKMANVSLRSGKDGETALSCAVRECRPEILELLLRTGLADLSLTYRDGLTLRLIAQQLTDHHFHTKKIGVILSLLDTYIFNGRRGTSTDQSRNKHCGKWDHGLGRFKLGV